MKIKELEKIKGICESVIVLQEKMRKCFFWTPPRTANERRKYEERNSQDKDFIFKGKKYVFAQYTSCSRTHIYFFSRFYEDGEQKDSRLVRKVLDEVHEELAKARKRR